MRRAPIAVLVISLSLGFLAGFGGCSKKGESLTISGWETYHNQFFPITFTHPKGWSVSADGNKVNVYSNAASAPKFVDWGVEAPDGVRLLVGYQKLDSLQDVTKLVGDMYNEYKSSGFKISPLGKKTIAGAEWVTFEYSGKVKKELVLKEVRYAVVKDTVLYTLYYSGFNDLFDQGRIALDSVLSSFTFPLPKSQQKAQELVEVPSPNFESFDNFALRVSYPDNFDTRTPRPSGNVTFSLELRGVRQDCNIRIDVIPAKGLSPDKVLEQNLKNYKVTSRGETRIDGDRVPYINYSIAKGIESRVYFLVKNDKWYRVTMNVNSSLKKDFLPAFDKCIGSIKAK